ncbi:MAG TPA: HAD-IIIA family hydrolase [Bryobacteraceae bacterium]|nr:HAD-IIIA family hydrolase [Bryobacteraceae bacterium]
MTAATSLAAEGRFHHDLGIWIWTRSRPASGIRPALFLDRDGVIVEDSGYLSKPSELTLLPEAASVIGLANRLGITVVEVTNQAGIARGYYGWNEFVEVEEALARKLAAASAALDGVFACPFHPDGNPPWAHPAHPARKPSPGMLRAAGRLLSIDLGRSWIVGDKLDDLLAGYQAGLFGGLHVLSGHGAEQRRQVAEWQPQNYNVRLGNSISDAAALLTALE